MLFGVHRHGLPQAQHVPTCVVHSLHLHTTGLLQCSLIHLWLPVLSCSLSWPQHLVPLLDRPSSWDVLIAHYLGVDHAGHTYGVNSRHMEDKLAQMDTQVSTVIGEHARQHSPRTLGGT
jgi:predicted AlkP superfamily pyrophosphatase or phosphodiesterase